MTLGVYCGSFNPFHVGHLDIANKAKKIFNVVTIVQAINPKKISIYKLPDSLQDRFNIGSLDNGKMLTDYINNLELQKNFTSVTLIRGLRNEKDFEYEENLCAAYRLLKPDINIIHIFADPKYNFVSSSLLRDYGNIYKFKELIVK